MARDKSQQPPKLQKLPKGVKIQKRPLLHPAVPSSRKSASSQKMVYLSTKTPFMSAVKRVKSLLVNVEKRATQAELTRSRASRGRGRGGAARGNGRLNGNDEGVTGAGVVREEAVVIKATGKAIERALAVALFLQGLGDLNVNISTGSVAAIDDVIVKDESSDGLDNAANSVPTNAETTTDGKGATGVIEPVAANKQAEPVGDDEIEDEEGDKEIPESRLRMTSVIEVAVSLKS